MRGLNLFAGLLALLGVTLGVEAWLAGSLFRYQLAGYVAGTALALPAVSILLLRERGRRLWRTVLFAAVPLIALLVLAEIGMRVFARTPPPPERLVTDDRLGHVLVPGSGGSDAWGFRNDEVPAGVDALFVGDSQTWGFFLEREQAFPALFAQNTGLSSYQMANGSYGPVHYRELLRRGLELKPRLVVVGFYFGNDLFDAAVSAGLDGGEDLRAKNRDYPKPHNPEVDGATAPNWTMAFVDWIQTASRLIGWAGEVVKSRLRGGSSLLDDQPGAIRMGEGEVATMLLPDYRTPPLDLTNQLIADGMRITECVVGDIARDCRRADARCLLLSIPTKEYCYAEWARQSGAPREELAGIHAAETEVRARLFAAVAAAELELVDLAPICIEALAAGKPMWANNGDGHIMVNGHLAAARAIERIWSAR